MKREQQTRRGFSGRDRRQRLIFGAPCAAIFRADSNDARHLAGDDGDARSSAATATEVDFDPAIPRLRRKKCVDRRSFSLVALLRALLAAFDCGPDARLRYAE
jgi:hypothetical protein